jgi:hypothetical protein
LPCVLTAEWLILLTGSYGFCQSVPQPSKFVESRTVQEAAASPRHQMVRNASTNLSTFNALDSFDPDWNREAFHITSFMIGANPPQTGQLIELDYRRNRAIAWTIPTGIGSWGVIKEQDVPLAALPSDSTDRLLRQLYRSGYLPSAISNMASGLQQLAICAGPATVRVSLPLYDV